MSLLTTGASQIRSLICVLLVNVCVFFSGSCSLALKFLVGLVRQKPQVARWEKPAL